jgi:hypothetical protein
VGGRGDAAGRRRLGRVLAGRARRARPHPGDRRNFAWTLPVAALLAAWPGAWAGASATGVALALGIGRLTSGLGYVAWYLALPALSRTAAATVQLAVPLVAALGAVALLGETIDARLALAAALVLGGIGAVVLPRADERAERPRPHAASDWAMTTRTFVALPLPAEVKAAIADLRAPCRPPPRGLRWAPSSRPT